MYKVFFNPETKAHSIVDNNVYFDEECVVVYEGSLPECKEYLAPLGVIYQTIHHTAPSECEGVE